MQVITDFGAFPPGIWRLSALGYAGAAGGGLATALFFGWSLHRKGLLQNGCNVPEIWPSVSATIGDNMPERGIWHMSAPFLATCLAFVLVGMHRIYSVRSTVGTIRHGEHHHHHHHHHPSGGVGGSPTSPVLTKLSQLYRAIFGTWELYEWHTALNAMRLGSAYVWIFVPSSSSVMVHEAGFGFFVVLGMAQHSIAYVFARRFERQFVAQYPPNSPIAVNDPARYAAVTLALSRARQGKGFGMIGQAVAISLFAKFFLIDHGMNCMPYAYSKACFFEWTFSYLDIWLDASYYFDMLACDLMEGTSADTGLMLPQRGHHHAQVNNSTGGINRSPKGDQRNNSNDTHAMLEAVRAGDNNSSSSGSYSSTQPPSPDCSGAGAAEFGSTLQHHHHQHHHLPAVAAAAAAASGSIGINSFATPYLAWLPTAVARSGMPRPLLWVADIFFGYLLVCSALSAFQAVYFVPMVAMTFTPEVACLFVPAVISALLRFPSFLKLFVPVSPAGSSGTTSDAAFRPTLALWAVYGIASLSFLHTMITESAGDKIKVACLGPGFAILAFRVRAVLHSIRQAALERRRTFGGEPQSCPAVTTVREELRDEASRLSYAVPLGLLFSLVVRYYFVSVDPFYTYAHFGPLATFSCLLVFIPTLAMHERFIAVQVASVSSRESGEQQQQQQQQQPTTEINEDFFPSTITLRYSTGVSPVHNSLIVGVAFGAASFLGVQYCSSATVIQRLVAVDPLTSLGPLLLVCSFAGGLMLSVLYAHPRDWRQRALVHALFVVGPLVLWFGTRQSNKMVQTESSSLESWGMQGFRGSPEVAFFGGMLLVFATGTVLPATCAAFWGMPVSLGLLNDGRLHDRPVALSAVASGFCTVELACFFTAVAFVFINVYVIAFPFVPGGRFFRDRYELILFPLCIITLLTQRYLFPHAEYYTERGLGDVTSGEDKAGTSPTPSPRGNALLSGATSVSGFAAGAEPQSPAARLDSVYSWSDLDMIPQTPVGETGVFPIPFETVRIRISIRTLIAGFLLAGIWRLVQQPSSNARDPYGRPMWLPDVFSREIITNAAYGGSDFAKEELFDAYERANGKGNRTFLIDESPIVSKSTFAHITSAIWTLHFALDDDGVDSLDRIVERVRDHKISVLGLLETDSAHVQTANRDLVEYIGYHTGLTNTDYGPTTAESTFGCALLTRYKIVSVRRIVLPSPMGELACMIDAVLEVPSHQDRAARGSNKISNQIRVLVGHNGNTDHVQDLVLQTDLIGRSAAESATNGLPVIFLGYVTAQPGLVGHNYYRMVQSDGHEIDKMLEHSSELLFTHGYDAKSTGKSVALPKIPMPVTKDRFRDVARDYMLWSGKLLAETVPPTMRQPWMSPRYTEKPRAYWEPRLRRGVEYEFLWWVNDLAAESAAIKEQTSGPNSDWHKSYGGNTHAVRAQLEIAARQLWDDIVAKGLGVAVDPNPRWVSIPNSPNKENKEKQLSPTYHENLVVGARNGRLFRMFLDSRWKLPDAAEHQDIDTRYHSVMSEPPKFRPEHPRYNFEDRYCQQIYYRDVMILDWYRITSGRISDTELQIFTFAV